MMVDPLDEARLAEAWVAPDGSPRDPSGCPAPDRYWDAARGTLDAAELRLLLDHTVSCAACALALKTAFEIHAASGLAGAVAFETQRRVARGSTTWAWLRATILRPEAALAYLLLLAVSFPVYRRFVPSVTPLPSLTPIVRGVRIVGLESEAGTRGGDRSRPAGVAAAGTESIVLRLFLDREDLVAGAPLDVTLSTGGRVLTVQSRDASTLGATGTLDLAIDADMLPRGVPLRLTVMSGTVGVFERSFVLESPDRR